LAAAGEPAEKEVAKPKAKVSKKKIAAVKKKPVAAPRVRRVKKIPLAAPAAITNDQHQAEPAPNVKRRKIDNLFGIISFIVILIVLALIVDVFGLYRWQWQDSFSRGVARVFCLPAGTVNGQNIKLADYLDDLRLLATAAKNNREGLTTDYGNNGYNSNIFLRLAANLLVRQKLKQYNSVVSDQAVRQQLNDIISQIGGQAEAAKTIKSLYDLNIKEFADKVLAPLMARDALQGLIAQDENLDINKKAKAKAEEVLRLAQQPGVDFGELAKQFTEDETGINTGGELGWVALKEINPAWGQGIFATPANTVYSQLIKNRVGYHIVKVEGKAANATTSEQSVQLRQIVINVNVDEYIKELLDQAKIKKFVQ